MQIKKKLKNGNYSYRSLDSELWPELLFGAALALAIITMIYLRF